jgi:hypothetical protein
VVDRSGSMGTYDRSGRTLMDLAKEAAVTVVDTLNPDDRVCSDVNLFVKLCIKYSLRI